MADNPEVQERVARYAMDALNRVTKWRGLFAGWQLGSRPKGEPESDAVRDHREATILLRVEMSAVVGLLLKKGTFTELEWAEQLAIEAEALEALYEKRFPGIRATIDGLAIDLPGGLDTMRAYRFNP